LKPVLNWKKPGKRERTRRANADRPFVVFVPRDPGFYMLKVKGDEEYTESCDLLMPGVGEIVGGSMRMTDTAQLLQGFKEHGINPAQYEW